MNKFEEQLSSILKKEEIEVHTRLIGELIDYANNKEFVNVYKDFPDDEKPDVLLTDERDYLFYGDAKLCENKVINSNNAAEQISYHIDRYFQHIRNKLLPGGMIAIYIDGIIKGNEWDSMLRRACINWKFKSLSIAPADSHLRGFHVATIYTIDITKHDN